MSKRAKKNLDRKKRITLKFRNENGRRIVLRSSIPNFYIDGRFVKPVANSVVQHVQTSIFRWIFTVSSSIFSRIDFFFDFLKRLNLDGGWSTDRKPEISAGRCLGVYIVSFDISQP